MNRPSIDEYMVNLLPHIAARGTCSRRQVGAIAVDREGVIITTGYNGAPSKARHCDHGAYARAEDDPDLYRVNNRWSCQRANHAEANLVYHAAKRGVALAGTIVYCDTFPCFNCLRSLIAAGVQESVFLDDYQNDPMVEQLCAEVGFKLRRFTT